MSIAAARTSVVIPVHNGERYLAETLQSVLDQDCPALEIIVVDNASTDDSGGVARSFPGVRCLRLEQRGVSRALNRGIEQSAGEYLAFIDADDLWTPDKLALQQDALAREPGVDMVFGQVRQFVSPELDAATRARLKVRDEVLPGRIRGSMLIRRESFGRVGAFAEDTNFAEFIDWFMRAREAGLRDLVLPRVLMLRRIHGANMTLTQQAQRVSYARVLKRGLDRRRRRGEE